MKISIVGDRTRFEFPDCDCRMDVEQCGDGQRLWIVWGKESYVFVRVGESWDLRLCYEPTATYCNSAQVLIAALEYLEGMNNCSLWEKHVSPKLGAADLVRDNVHNAMQS